MPNWIKNKVTITGDINELRKVHCFLCPSDSKDNSFDFNRIIPMPESLNIEESSFMQMGLKLYKNFLSYCGFDLDKELNEVEKMLLKVKEDYFLNILEGDNDKKKMFRLGKKAYNNIKKYGAPCWYEWCNNNWGTKWNAVRSIIFFDKASNCIYIHFETAWSCPEPIFKALSKKFPNVEISVDYADEDIGYNCGHFTFKNEAVSSFVFKDEDVSNKNTTEGNRKAIKFACEVWNYNIEEYLEESDDDE